MNKIGEITMAVKAIFVGATIQGAPGGAEFFSNVKVPGSMSKQTTIDNHVSKARDARQEHMEFPAMAFAGSVLPNSDVYENHAQRPMVGMLASMYILAANGEVMYQHTAAAPVRRGEVALPLINYLKETYPDQFASSLRHGDAAPQVIIFGFNLKQVLRIAAFEVLQRNAEARDIEQVHIPVRLWHNPVGVYDPLDVLLPSSDQRDLDLYSVLRYFGVQATAEELSISSKRQAEVVKALVEHAQLA